MIEVVVLGEVKTYSNGMVAERVFGFLLVGLGWQLFGAAPAIALEKKDVVGTWAIDQDKSKAASDGNTAGLMAQVTVKDDGTFEALFGPILNTAGL